MEEYTAKTKAWLDDRFRNVDKDGVYFAHQPIYGFRKGHSEEPTLIRYAITYQIARALSHLRFSSLIDVGGAEGYKAALARKLFNIKQTRSVDLSEEACRRAKEIFDIDGEAVDIHQLPYDNEAFDVVVCSETLEHVVDVQRAAKELLRVCRKAVIITVPHEPREEVERNIEQKIPHAHIHSLDLSSFDFLLPYAKAIYKRRMHSGYTKLLFQIAEAAKRTHTKYPGFMLTCYNMTTPILRRVFNKLVTSLLLLFDDFLANLVPSYSTMVFTILKDGESYSKIPLVDISPMDILNFNVPLLRLDHSHTREG